MERVAAMNADPQQAKAIFLEAVEKHGPDQWPAFLDQACSGQPELRRRVEVLLDAHREAGTAAQQAGDEGPPRREENGTGERPGTVIGPYKLLQQIGEGGMGVVWMAEQTQPVQRKVALKVIKPGMDSRQVITRFEAERQALAMMDHVNIARVFDAGATEAGRPYFVMELVHGVPITKYCDDNRLTPRERLELFVPVCQAIQHAHQKGIIHRDVKPSNVMITLYDGKPVPKVIDFGVAKATEQKLTERTLFTQYGSMVGTLEYMSPEQAAMSALGVDTRSDIYSLGVLLYELLTGSTPLTHKRMKEAAYAEILRMIKEEEPPKPSTRLSDSGEALASISANRHTEPAKLTKLVKGELDWIVMKCLEKDRNRRYESASALAADMQRYLNDEPVQACPPSAGYRLRKFVRRNKKTLAMIAVVAVIMLAGSIISTWQAIRATRSEHTAQVNFERARRAVKQMLTRVAQEELVGIPGMEQVRKALLKDALEFYEQLLAERSTDPEIRLATAEAHIALAWISWRLGETAILEPSHQRALNLLEGLAKEFPEDLQYRTALAQGLHDAGQRNIYPFDKRRWKDGAQLVRRAIALQENVVSFKRDSADEARALTKMWFTLGQGLDKANQLVEAEAAYNRVVSISEGVLANEPNHPSHLRIQARALTCIAELLRRKDPAQAAALLVRAQALAVRFQAGPKTMPSRGFFDDGRAQVQIEIGRVLGGLYLDKGRTQEAQAAYRRNVALARKCAEDYPSNVLMRGILAYHYLILANSLTDPADREEAEQAWQQGIQIWERLASEFTQEPNYRWQLALAYRNFAAWLKAAERLDEAEKAYRQALAVSVKLIDAVSGDSDYLRTAGVAAENLGHLLEDGEQFAEAERHYRQALEFFQASAAADPANANDPMNVARVERRLANLLRAVGDFQKAIQLYEKLMGQFPLEAAYRQQLSAAHHDRALAANEDKRRAEAEEAFRKALQISETAAADFPKDARAWHMLGHRARYLAAFLMTHKRPAEAEKVWVKGIHALETGGAMPDPIADNCRYFAAMTRRLLAESALAQSRAKEAEEQLQKALDTFHTLPGAFLLTDRRHPNVTDCANRYAGWLRAQGRPQEAIAVMQRCIDFYNGLLAKTPGGRIFRDELVDQSRKLAWLLATSANPKNRDGKRAVELAKKAVELAPEQGICWNTLGVAQYRTENWKDAAAALEKSMELRKGGDSHDWFFLAVAHWKLGHKDEAREWYDRAVAWMDTNEPKNEELRRFRAEAADLLRIDKK
jgi:eukaryotic-like serine/threonine-protein kinase